MSLSEEVNVVLRIPVRAMPSTIDRRCCCASGLGLLESMFEKAKEILIHEMI